MALIERYKKTEKQSVLVEFSGFVECFTPAEGYTADEYLVAIDIVLLDDIKMSSITEIIEHRVRWPHED